MLRVTRGYKSPRFTRWVQIVIAMVLAAVVVVIIGLRSDAPKGDYLLQTQRQTYVLEAVTTPASQKRGLGGRESMPQNQGMLFPYDREDKRCFWMKSMRFPIDIIWVDSRKRITHVEAGLQPSSYPQTYCAQAQYVIELNSGEARKNNLKAGLQLTF